MQIKKSIPAPETPVAKGRPAAWPFEEMKPGDSFPFLKERIKAVRTAAWRRKIKHGEEFLIGLHERKWRCWRVS
jgi:hypothetical protein